MKIWLKKMGNFKLTFVIAAIVFLVPVGVFAATQTINQNLNVTAIVPGPAPTTPAVITSPVNGSFTQVTPIVISGTCGPGLTVKVFNNSQLIGSTLCTFDGTFSINTSLGFGVNVLTALNYDSLDQAGPSSPAITVSVEYPGSPPTPTTTPSGPKKLFPSRPAAKPENPKPVVIKPLPQKPTKVNQAIEKIDTFVKSDLFVFISITTFISMFIVFILRNKKKR